MLSHTSPLELQEFSKLVGLGDGVAVAGARRRSTSIEHEVTAGTKTPPASLFKGSNPMFEEEEEEIFNKATKPTRESHSRGTKSARSASYDLDLAAGTALADEKAWAPKQTMASRANPLHGLDETLTPKTAVRALKQQQRRSEKPEQAMI